jgi:alkylated DNA repair dioxygenase AlkB
MSTSYRSANRYRLAASGDLFEERELPDGFRYMSDVLSATQERDLVQRFEALPLRPFEFRGYLANRRIYTFGHRYLFAGQQPRHDATIPDYLLPLTQIAADISGVPADRFEQVMVSEYPPGAGIGWHRDRPTFDRIVAISFLAPCTLRLRQRREKDWERQAVHIEPRSAYLLEGPVRDRWQHSISPMDVLRYSVTLRTFSPGHASIHQELVD